MKAHNLRGMLTLLKVAPQIQKSWRQQPAGLLKHEDLAYSLFPLHLGMRQYWRDFDSLEAFARDMPHQKWWVDFMKNPGGTSFWHETYALKGGFEAIYTGDLGPLGLSSFGKAIPAKGGHFGARGRLYPGQKTPPAPVPEE